MLGVLLVAVIAAAGSVGYAVRCRRRGVRWNAHNLCAWCAARLEVDHALVEGLQLCPACARQAAWRVGAAAFGAAAASIFLGVAITVPYLGWWWRGIPVGVTSIALATAAALTPLGLGYSAVRRMQARNRQVLRAGEEPREALPAGARQA